MGLREWVQPVAYCEIEPYCQSVLLQRMSEGYLPKAPIWDDIRTLSSGNSDNESSINIIYGGFPCQDISVAGRGAGLEGERSGLFFEIMRLAQEIKPQFLFLENVPAITSRGGLRVVREIATLGYDCRWCVISAASVGALHQRERWFLLAHASSQGLEGFRNGTFCPISKKPMPSSGCDDVSDTEHLRLSQCKHERQPRFEKRVSEGCCLSNADSQPSQQADPCAISQLSKRNTWGKSSGQYWPFESREHWQEAVSTVCRTSDGVSRQVDRLKSLGNAVVPQQVYQAFKILSGL